MNPCKEMKKTLFIVALILLGLWACKKDEPDIPAPSPQPTQPTEDGVVLNLNEIPYLNLSDYQFFVGDMRDLEPNEGVLPYDVITPLFSDYAKKKRFVWMPDGSSATYVSDDASLNFPEGTVLIKNFYFNNVLPQNATKLIETRLMILKNGVWEFSDYVWNEEQTEAILENGGVDVPLQWIDENGQERDQVYRVPDNLECITCHKSYETPIPIGMKPQQLNKSYEYTDGMSNQLLRWQDVGYLSGTVPSNITSVVAWDNESESLRDRVRAYMDMNCAHCHTDGGHCDYRALRLAWNESDDDTNLGICVEPEEAIEPQHVHLISAGNTTKSVMHFRLNTNVENYRMPLLGRTVVHEEAVELLADYINSLSINCE